jgi:hypothetical protein
MVCGLCVRQRQRFLYKATYHQKMTSSYTPFIYSPRSNFYISLTVQRIQKGKKTPSKKNQNLIIFSLYLSIYSKTQKKQLLFYTYNNVFPLHIVFVRYTPTHRFSLTPLLRSELYDVQPELNLCVCMCVFKTLVLTCHFMYYMLSDVYLLCASTRITCSNFSHPPRCC